MPSLPECGPWISPVVHIANICAGIGLVVSGILSLIGLFTSLGGVAKSPLGFLICLYVAYENHFLCHGSITESASLSQSPLRTHGTGFLVGFSG